MKTEITTLAYILEMIANGDDCPELTEGAIRNVQAQLLQLSDRIPVEPEAK